MSGSLRPTEAFETGRRRIGIALDEEQVQRLGRFLQLLLETNRKFNLTGIRDPDEAWLRHILDSLSLLPFVGDARSVIDVGSGGGLPGVPLAIARPDLRIALLEATGKKARFLESTARQLDLDRITVVHDRAETIGQDRRHRQRYDLAVARAIGPMNVLLELTLPLVRVGGRVLAMKGRAAERELRDCGDALMTLGGGDVRVCEALPGVEGEAVIIEVTKQSPTPRRYPRRPGLPKMEPL